MKKLAITFRIRYDKGCKKYVKVFIFRDQDTMYKFYETQLGITGQQDEYLADFTAMFQPFKTLVFKNGTQKEKNHMGNLLFYADKTGSGVVAHECGHASLYWYSENNPHPKEHKIIPNMDKEEELLFTLGYLVAQFWKNYFRYQKLIEANQ